MLKPSQKRLVSVIIAAVAASLLLGGCALPGAFWQRENKKPLPETLRLPSIFSDHCVIQAGVPIRVWGWDRPGQSIEVKLQGTSHTKTGDSLAQDVCWKTGYSASYSGAATAGPDGRWQVELGPVAEGYPFEMRVEGSCVRTVRDMAVGEVWLCSGQSNMVWPLDLSTEGLREAAKANDPLMRVYRVRMLGALAPSEDAIGQWHVVDRETAQGMSAAAYYFGRDLRKSCDAPVGLVQSAFGGSRIEAWIPRTDLMRLPRSAMYSYQCADAISPQKYTESRKKYERDILSWMSRSLKTPPYPVGEKAGWAQRDFDESIWPAMHVPGAWEYQDLNMDGVVWFRRRFDLPEQWDMHPLLLSLGAVDDMDTVWVNGFKVGGIGPETEASWDYPRRYVVPAAAVHPGENVLAVRVTDLSGNGGMWGMDSQFFISPEDAASSAGVQLAGSWRWAVEGWWGSDNGPAPAAPENPWGRKDMPSYLYNGMIAPLAPFAMRGVIWYQGESNALESSLYPELMETMIGSWRAAWKKAGQADADQMPFLYSQLAPFGGAFDAHRPIGAMLREAQVKTLERVPRAAMVSIMDLGDCADIHPKRKEGVGERLALAARALAYGEKVEWSGPMYREMRVEQGRALLGFDHVADGLRAEPPDAPLKGFWVAGADRVFFPARAEIRGNRISVCAPEVETPAAVRFGWADCPDTNLFNSEGLSASSFRTDNWDDALMIPLSQ